ISSSTTTILSHVWLFLCLIPSISLRPSALSLNRTVSFLLSTLPPSLCTAHNHLPCWSARLFPAAAAPAVYATSVLPSRRHPSRRPFHPPSPVHAWLLLVAPQLCLHPLGSAVYSPGRTFRRRCSLLPPPIYNATYKGSR
ncbi:hypothetical protein GQ42DRAFT_161012, partial [Ramicandelaber brevisporus]